MKSLLLIATSLVTVALSFAAGASWGGKKSTADLESRIFQKSDARKSLGDWGSIHIYTSEETSTYGTDSMLTAELEFLPGKQLQPPHRHENEEFQYIIEGTGTWFLNGRETRIKPGDLMYAKPWDLHGISNTGTTPLRFFVMKWNNKGVEKPVAGSTP